MLSTMFIVVSTLLARQTLAAPISTAELAIDASFSSNVIMTSGASQFAMWVPTDGGTYATSSIECLNILSSSVGSCSIASIDQIAAFSGYTCAFYGSNGWSGSQAGSDSSGWLKVAPPQTIVAVACM